MNEERLADFIEYASNRLTGYEKGEAQLFLDHLFVAFGHKGVVEAQAKLECQLTIDDRTKYADLLWPKRVLIEMKGRGEKLEKHFSQAKRYWDEAYGERTQYVILCNFDEFWIYDWNKQRDPLDKVPLAELKDRWRALAFLCPEPEKAIFQNNCVAVTEEVAEIIAELYKSLLVRGIDPERAQRFTLQCLVALFADDTGLFPKQGFFDDLVSSCLEGEESSYDVFTQLFEKMNSETPPKAGKFKGLKYFNGGIFSKVYPIELTPEELNLLATASKANWSKVQPSIFGSIFQDSLNPKERHNAGAHYTSEADIMRVIEPTVLRPWRRRIASAKTLAELNSIQEQLSELRILDPACGSGNFLYVAFRELKHLELELFQKILDNYPSAKPERLQSGIKSCQFYGIDTNPLGIELAKVTLSMAKKFAVDAFNAFTKQHRFYEDTEQPLPFDNLDSNLIVADALFTDWPKADIIIGNPPYQSKNKMVDEFGPEYMQKLHERYPDISGRADYCVYWFRKAHDALPEGGRAGLVGTNTIRQTYSRTGGLDYIVNNSGTILDAVGTMPWSGDAAVHISIVNWIRGREQNGKRILAIQKGDQKDGPWEVYKLDVIPSSLSPAVDVTRARLLKTNASSGACYQGQTHGHKGFLLLIDERRALLEVEPEAEEVTFPYLIADEMIGILRSQPKRYVIDFQPRSTLPEVIRYKKTFEIIKQRVLPTIAEKAKREMEKYENLTKKENVRQNHLETWWLLWRRREELIRKIGGMDRYIACGRVTKRQIFEFISSSIRPNDSLAVFAYSDDYSFGILQSSYHWEWFKERCSTLKADFRYTSNTVFDTFPWPQWGTLPGITPVTKKGRQPKKTELDYALDVAVAARELRAVRRRICAENSYSLRDLYRTLELPGANELRTAQEKLDSAVKQAYLYKMPQEMKRMGVLELLLELNQLCAEAESSGHAIVPPGLPQFATGRRKFYSNDCVTPLEQPT